MFRPCAAIYHKFWSEESCHIASTLPPGCIHAHGSHLRGAGGSNRPVQRSYHFSWFFDFCEVATVVEDVGESPKAGKPEYYVTVTQ